MSRNALPVVLAVLLSACGDDEPDAYGNFEAREVVVSAEVGGSLVRFEPDEGEMIANGAVVGQIDTATLALQRAELIAQARATRSRVTGAEAQIAVQQAQLATARDEYARTLRLYEAEAATARQLEQAEGAVRVLEERINAAQAEALAAGDEADGVQARIAQIEEQIAKSRITNPIAGTVLTTYVEEGEFVQPGAPLYRIANLEILTLRAYVSGAQLARVRLGARVDVRFDSGTNGLATVPGRVAWIASEAEFTPTPVQTREERTDRVYAVRVDVPNPAGAIKIGMPGELFLAPRTDEPEPTAAPPEVPPGARP